MLCFLGFVNRYKCLSEDFPLTVSLFLNHRLVQLYIAFLEYVRGASEGTIGEALTAAISAFKWLYRKEKSAQRLCDGIRTTAILIKQVRCAHEPIRVLMSWRVKIDGLNGMISLPCKIIIPTFYNQIRKAFTHTNQCFKISSANRFFDNITVDIKIPKNHSAMRRFLSGSVPVLESSSPSSTAL